MKKKKGAHSSSFIRSIFHFMSTLSLALLHQPTHTIEIDQLELQPSRLHEYVVLQLLSEGGQSRVWFAIPRETSSFTTNKVVLKQYDMLPHRQEGIILSRLDLETEHQQAQIRLQRFKWELKIYQNLQQTKVRGILYPLTAFYDASRHQGYLVLPYIEMPANMDVFFNSLTNDQLIRSMNQLVDTVTQLHAQGLIHGDIKPKNVLWDRFTQRPFLIDFGSSQYYLPGMSMDVQVGTKAFQPPELRLDSKDSSTDVTKNSQATTGQCLHRSADIWSMMCTFICWIIPSLKTQVQQGPHSSVVESYFDASFKKRKYKTWSDWYHHTTRSVQTSDICNKRIFLIQQLDRLFAHTLCLKPRKRWEAHRIGQYLRSL
ncbi:MAG: kinase-like protein [Sylvanvirus sp.]|uniref:non-specific serine/threonine protein kinase n=1 Tax=Sylvanvirus sp. TaxID=2487774 RepID=A0A3G5AHI7_9VIRU|nr:MAG: kinase-like protein [Sylvanvirus sp.]